MDKSLGPTGQCFPFAWNQTMDNPGATLVHGQVHIPSLMAATGSPGIIDENVPWWSDHAWVEHNGLAWDAQGTDNGNKPIPTEDYYQMLKVRDPKYYTQEVARINALKTEHYGPWSNQELNKGRLSRHTHRVAKWIDALDLSEDAAQRYALAGHHGLRMYAAEQTGNDKDIMELFELVDWDELGKLLEEQWNSKKSDWGDSDDPNWNFTKRPFEHAESQGEPISLDDELGRYEYEKMMAEQRAQWLRKAWEAWDEDQSDPTFGNAWHYDKADQHLQAGRNKDHRPVARNTWVERNPDGSIGFRLHDTHIMTFHPNGDTTYNTGGWYSQVTMNRMNYGPHTIFRNRPTTKGVPNWWVSTKGSRGQNADIDRTDQYPPTSWSDRAATPYFDGMIIDRNGAVVNPEANPGQPRYHYYSNKWDSLHESELPEVGTVWEWNPWNARAGNPFIIDIFSVEDYWVEFFYTDLSTPNGKGLKWENMTFRQWGSWLEQGCLKPIEQRPLFAHTSGTPEWGPPPGWDYDKWLESDDDETFKDKVNPSGMPRPMYQDLPVPWTADMLMPLGDDPMEPAFKQVDVARLEQCWHYGLCVLCGLQLTDPVYAFFDEHYRTIVDGALHQRCAVMTRAHCPHIRDAYTNKQLVLKMIPLAEFLQFGNRERATDAEGWISVESHWKEAIGLPPAPPPLIQQAPAINQQPIPGVKVNLPGVQPAQPAPAVEAPYAPGGNAMTPDALDNSRNNPWINIITSPKTKQQIHQKAQLRAQANALLAKIFAALPFSKMGGSAPVFNWDDKGVLIRPGGFQANRSDGLGGPGPGNTVTMGPLTFSWLMWTDGPYYWQARTALVHEIAHLYQTPEVMKDDTLREGGATAYAVAKMPQIFGQAGSIPSYATQEAWVEQNKGQSWIMYEQFGLPAPATGKTSILDTPPPLIQPAPAQPSQVIPGVNVNLPGASDPRPSPTTEAPVAQDANGMTPSSLNDSRHLTNYPQFQRGVTGATLSLSRVTLNEQDAQTSFPNQPNPQGSVGSMVAVWVGIDDGTNWIQAGITKEAGKSPYIYFESSQGSSYKLLNLGGYSWGQQIDVQTQHNRDGSWSMLVNGRKLGTIKFTTYNVHLVATGESRFLSNAPTRIFNFTISPTKKTSMAQQTGDPELDTLLDKFLNDVVIPEWKNQQANPGQYTMEGETAKSWRTWLSKPGICGEMALWFHDWLWRQGIEDWNDDPNSGTGFSGTFYDPELTNEHLPHPWTGFPIDGPDELGYHDRPVRGYPNHEATLLRNKDGRIYSIDWAAGQYGYKSFPMVQRLDNGKWQRRWSGWAETGPNGDGLGFKPGDRVQLPDGSLGTVMQMYENEQNEDGTITEWMQVKTDDGQTVQAPDAALRFVQGLEGGVMPNTLPWRDDEQEYYRTSMAERTGDPELDKLIQEFVSQDPWDYGIMADDGFDQYRDPQKAKHQCVLVAQAFASFISNHGITSNLVVKDTDLGSIGYENKLELAGDDFHTVVEVTLPSGTYMVDFTAAQYGYKEFPMVQRLNDGGSWDRQWTSATVTSMGEWYEDPNKADWQHGLCDVYAAALLHMHPHLRLGTLDQGMHYFAHDDTHAYDSIGRHPLPYTGYGENEGEMEPTLDEKPSDYWFPNEQGVFVGENGGPEDFERAKALIPQQHPYLQNAPASSQEPRSAGIDERMHEIADQLPSWNEEPTRVPWTPQLPQKVIQEAIYKRICPMCRSYLRDRGGVYTCSGCPFEYPYPE